MWTVIYPEGLRYWQVCVRLSYVMHIKIYSAIYIYIYIYIYIHTQVYIIHTSIQSPQTTTLKHTVQTNTLHRALSLCFLSGVALSSQTLQRIKEDSILPSVCEIPAKFSVRAAIWQQTGQQMKTTKFIRPKSDW